MLILGEIPDGSKHYYYGNYCKVARYPAEKRQLSPEFLESLDSLDQEERQTVRRSRAVQRSLVLKEPLFFIGFIVCMDLTSQEILLLMPNTAFRWVL